MLRWSRPVWRGSGEVGSAAGAGAERPARVLRAPLGRQLHSVSEGSADLEPGGEVLLEALGDALLVVPDVDGLADQAGAGLEEITFGVSSR